MSRRISNFTGSNRPQPLAIAENSTPTPHTRSPYTPPSPDTFYPELTLNISNISEL